MTTSHSGCRPNVTYERLLGTTLSSSTFDVIVVKTIKSTTWPLFNTSKLNDVCPSGGPDHSGATYTGNGGIISSSSGPLSRTSRFCCCCCPPPPPPPPPLGGGFSSKNVGTGGFSFIVIAFSCSSSSFPPMVFVFFFVLCVSFGQFWSIFRAKRGQKIHENITRDISITIKTISISLSSLQQHTTEERERAPVVALS